MSTCSFTTSNTGVGGGDENELFQLWRETQDEQVLEKLFKALRYHAESVCVLTLGRSDQEIADEAITKALYMSDKFRGDSKFSTWFHAIVLNLCRTAIRDKMRRQQVELTDDVGAGMFEDSLEAEIALEKLTEGLKEEEMFLVRCKLEGMTLPEIAEKSGETLDCVTSRWRRLEERMRDGRV